jgi:hypothetical protein
VNRVEYLGREDVDAGDKMKLASHPVGQNNTSPPESATIGF